MAFIKSTEMYNKMLYKITKVPQSNKLTWY